jgi:hypothetical protein
VRNLHLRDHLFAITVHGGILLAIFFLVIATSCQKEPPPPEPDPVGDFFEQMMDALDMEGVESISVIAVDNNSSADSSLQRQVLQEIQTELHNLEALTIREFPVSFLNQTFAEMGISPSDGISPDDAVELASDLNVNALLYASIESSAPDVYMKIYSGESGAVIFAETLEAWPLSVTRETEGATDLFSLPEEGAPPEGSESTGESNPS